MTITAAHIEARMAGLLPIGLGPAGTNRLAWTAEDHAAAEWFRVQAEDLGLLAERDPAGSLWAVPDAPGPWWAVGSHLDSVRDGGSYDGALGVAAAFEVAARLPRPVAVIAFADEEGARFNTPTFGSRALVGRLDIADALARRDGDGISMAAAMRTAGVDPDGLTGAPAWLGRLRGFLELHIDQTTELADAGAPAGVVAGLAARLRLALHVRGRADHSGTTPMHRRADALLAAARVVVAVNDLAAGRPGVVATATRLLSEPNALTTVAGEVRMWVDVRAPSGGDLDHVEAGVRDAAAAAAAQGGVRAEVTVASRSEAVTFDPGIRAALRAGLPPDARELLCFAGHDAGILAERIPAGMVFVRNATGISHAPQEHVEPGDAAAAAELMLDGLRMLTGT
ncbi:MAG: Zn-dependent hydrolase [Thermoleophilia bacterium]|nr:Zn-dependent hydrolase [Thermoleophilia bacterium]